MTMSPNSKTQLSDLIKLNDAVDLITIITVTDIPLNRTDLSDITFINEIFDPAVELSRTQAYINAVSKVKTPFTLFLKPGDKIKSDLVFPSSNKSMIFGDSYINESWGEQYFKADVFLKDKFLDNPYLINRPILRTENILPILQIAANENVDIESALYFIMAVVHGSQYDDRLKVVWNKRSDKDFQNNIFTLKEDTKTYLENKYNIFRLLIDNYNLKLDLKALTPFESFKNLLTVVTLSKEPLVRTDIGTLDYVNYVSTTNTEDKFFIAIKSAIRKVKTPYLIFVDSDDPMPERVILPEDTTGLVYGDFFSQSGKSIDRKKTGDFSDESFSRNVLMMHKPIYTTDKVRKIVEKLPILDNYVQATINYLVAKAFGAQYNKQLVVLWNKNNSGKMHTGTNNDRSGLFEFLKANEDNVIKSLNLTDILEL